MCVFPIILSRNYDVLNGIENSMLLERRTFYLSYYKYQEFKIDWC